MATPRSEMEDDHTLQYIQVIDTWLYKHLVVMKRVKTLPLTSDKVPADREYSPPIPDFLEVFEDTEPKIQ